MTKLVRKLRGEEFVNRCHVATVTREDELPVLRGWAGSIVADRFYWDDPRVTYRVGKQVEYEIEAAAERKKHRDRTPRVPA
jgi:hypothetical protein